MNDHPELEYRLLASGAHLDPHFGRTLNEIQSDGFRVDAEIKIDMDAVSLYSTAQAIGSGILSISEALARIQPDIMVVYADRFEGFAAVIASSQMNIPTAHVEGGDLTEGGALDGFRTPRYDKARSPTFYNQSASYKPNIGVR